LIKIIRTFTGKTPYKEVIDRDEFFFAFAEMRKKQDVNIPLYFHMEQAWSIRCLLYNSRKRIFDIQKYWLRKLVARFPTTPELMDQSS
jgi:hypothetical protein